MLNQPTALSFLARELGQTLGLKHAVLSPGSRSAPLILALGREPSLKAWPLIDERAAGFFALGLAKATGMPTVLACTSGTAAANYAPAVHEAREASVPLIVLTADRPPELRTAGENQTIDQVGVFGSAARVINMPPFDDTSDEAWHQFARLLVETSLAPTPGPVHVNVPLWDPLAENADDLPALINSGPAVVRHAPENRVLEPQIESLLNSAKRPILLLGRDESGGADALIRWASERNVPVFVDALAGQISSEASTAIPAWDSILRSEVCATDDPDLILRSGDLPTSKPLRTWLAGLATSGVPVLDFASNTSPRDPIMATTHRIESPLQAVDTSALMSISPEWTAAWSTVGRKALNAIDLALSTPERDLDELSLLHRLTTSELSDSTLFIAASMPVRDLELLYRAHEGPRCAANRGANGIDGTLSTGAGHAAGNDRPTFIVCGDVTFAHDLSGLAAVREAGGPVTIIVIDNAGGAIFDNLPISSQSDVYERFVLTPPEIDMQGAAAAYGIDYLELTGLQDIENLIAQRHRSAPVLCRLATERSTGRNARSALVAAVRAALES